METWNGQILTSIAASLLLAIWATYHIILRSRYDLMITEFHFERGLWAHFEVDFASLPCDFITISEGAQSTLIRTHLNEKGVGMYENRWQNLSLNKRLNLNENEILSSQFPQIPSKILDKKSFQGIFPLIYLLSLILSII